MIVHKNLNFKHFPILKLKTLESNQLNETTPSRYYNQRFKPETPNGFFSNSCLPTESTMKFLEDPID
jgi:hypothetical protein